MKGFVWRPGESERGEEPYPPPPTPTPHPLLTPPPLLPPLTSHTLNSDESKSYHVKIAACAGITSQKWTRLEVSDSVPSTIQHTPTNKLHKLESKDYTAKCLAISSSDLVFVGEGVGEVTLTSLGKDLTLKNCDER